MQELTALILPDVESLLQESPSQPIQEHIRDLVAELHPADTADLLEHLKDEEAAAFFTFLPNGTQREVFDFLTETHQVRLIEALGPQRMAPVIEGMSSDDRADLVKALPEPVVHVLLPLVAQAERNDIRRLVEYEEGTAGAVMSSEYAALSAELTAAAALERLRQIAPHRETIYYVYVVNQERRLVGVVSLQELILAEPGRRLQELMHTHLIRVNVHDSQEEAARTLSHYDFIAVPVVDAGERLVGIVTYDDVLDIVEEEDTQDVHQLGATQPLEQPYFDTGFWAMVRKRAPWLFLLFVGEMFTGNALEHYGATLEHALTLVFFIPLITSSGGNSGSQSATLITRALATGDVTLRDGLRIFLRESSMGLTLGLFLGIIGCARALVWGHGPLIAVTVLLALVAVVLCGTLTGSLMPLAFKRLGFDPAVTSSPFVASVVDVTGIVVYFSIAQLLLHVGG
ncbi:MAG: magnesium transporter [Candidatus Latescibacterota bacterium]